MLAVVALALRVLVARRAGIIESDGAYYCWLGGALLRGDLAAGLSTVWPPLYPALIAAAAGVAQLAGAPPTPEILETAARAVSLVMGLAMLAPLARLGERAGGARVGLLALAFAAVHPHLVQLSGAALTEATFTAMLVAAIAAWCAGRWVVAGAALGLATLVRPEGAAVAGALWLVGLWLPAGATRWRVGFLAAFACVVLPYAAFVTAQTGSPSFGEKGTYNFWRAYQVEYARVLPAPAGLSERVVDSPDLAARLPHVKVDVLGFVARSPGVVAARTLAQAAKLAFESLPLAAAPVFVALALVGAFVAPWPRVWPVALPIAACVALYAPFSTDRRFLMPVVPLVLVFAGLGAETVAVALARSAARKGRAIAVFATLVVAGHAAYTLALTRGIDDAPEHRAAGVWLREHPGAWREGEPGARAGVMSRKPWVAYYAGASNAELPAGGLHDVADRMRATSTRVLVIDARWGIPNRPWLAPLLDPAARRAALLLSLDRPHALRLYRVPPLDLAH
jgi:hypothetical protein